MKYSTWVNVDLKAIENNVLQLRKRTQVPVMAVVKANAYGHGLVAVAEAALLGGARWLGVARIEEALELRANDISCPVLVMGLTPNSEVNLAISNDISVTIWNLQHLHAFQRAADRLGTPAKVHLKVDTGMSRLGVALEDAFKVAENIVSTKSVIFEGIFTHYASADELDKTSAMQQEHDFRYLVDQLELRGSQPPNVHAANSAASLAMPGSRFNLIRPGISIYGLHPSPTNPLPHEFHAALEWKAVLSQVKVLPPGRGISYGHDYVTQGEERIGTIPVGYADGFRRIVGNQVLVGGIRVPVVGRVCMDQVTVQLDGVPAAQPGDEVVIIGNQGGTRISVEEVAERWGTINYEVVCGLAARLPRIYEQPNS